MERPPITGVTFPTDLYLPVDVSENATWGWFSNKVGRLSVTRAEDRLAAYSKAARVANRSRASVQIYANTGDGWKQVDTVTAPEVELCEWWPAMDQAATGWPSEGCGKAATVSVGASTNWHLCDACRKLPSFTRLSVRKAL